ncbi:MAG TPA: hypothetical protein VGF67_18420 [Ktedonobacteraceae bacterium]
MQMLPEEQRKPGVMAICGLWSLLFLVQKKTCSTLAGSPVVRRPRIACARAERPYPPAPGATLAVYPCAF